MIESFVSFFKIQNEKIRKHFLSANVQTVKKDGITEKEVQDVVNVMNGIQISMLFMKW